MRWLVDSNGQTSGPMDEAMLVALVKAGQIAPDAMVRQEADVAWEPIAQTRFAPPQQAQPEPVLPTKEQQRFAANKISTAQGCGIGVAVIAGIAVVGALAVFSTGSSDKGPPALPKAPAVATVATPSPGEIAAPFLAQVDAAWVAFDGLPKPQRTKDRFHAAITDQQALLDHVPESSARGLVAAHMLKMSRQRIAAWSSVGASFAGADATDLVPSANKAACLMWGSMWVNDVETLSAIMTMGFEQIVCPTKTWVLKDEASVCYLWSLDPDDQSKSPAIVWSTLDLYQKSLVVGKRTDDNGPLAYMALMSTGGGAATMMPGVKGTILDSGPGWFHIAGDNFSGYVPAELCHHTAAK